MASGLIVEQHRKGRFTFLEALPKLLPKYRLFRHRVSQTFTSKEAALQWYAYRSQWGLFPPIVFTIYIAIAVIYLLWMPDVPEEILNDVPRSFIVALYVDILIKAFTDSLIPATIIAGGIFLFQSWRNHNSQKDRFLYIRPVSVQALTAARWQSGVRAITIGLVPLIAITVMTLFLDMRYGPYDPKAGHQHLDHTFTLLHNSYPLYQVILMTLLAFSSLCAAVWAGLWFENVIVIGAVLGITVISIESLPALHETTPILRSHYALRTTTLFIATALTLLAISGFRKGLIFKKNLLITLGATPVFGFGFFLYLNIGPIIEQTPIDMSILTTIVPIYLLAVLSPLLTTPLITQWARHRK